MSFLLFVKKISPIIAGVGLLTLESCLFTPTWNRYEIIYREVHDDFVIEYIDRNIHDNRKYDMIAVYLRNKDGELGDVPCIWDLKTKKSYLDCSPNSRTLNSR